MGTVTLPTYEAQEVQKRAPWPRMDPSAAVAAGNAQMRFLNTLFAGATGIAENIIANQRADQMSAFMRTYSETSAQNLRDTEQNPITTRSPEFADIPEAERGAPNLSAYTKKRNVWLAKLIDGIKDSKVKRAASSWAADRWVSEKDGLARWDFAKTKEMRIDNYIEDFSSAVENGDLGTAKDLTQAMLMTGGLTEKQADDYLDLAHKDVTKRNAYLQAVGMGEEKGLEYLTERGNLRYQTYDGQIKDMPLADQEEMVARFLGQMKDIDEVKNAHYQGLHIRANTIADCDAALRELTLDVNWKDSEKWHRWETRFRRRRETLANQGGAPEDVKKARIEAQEEWEGRLEGMAAIMKYRGEPMGAIAEMFFEQFEQGRVRGPWVKKMLDYLDMDESSAIKYGKQALLNKVKNLSVDEQIRAIISLEQFYRDTPDATEAQIATAVENISKEVYGNFLDKGEFWKVLLGDRPVLTGDEQMLRNIQDDKYVGVLQREWEALNQLAARLRDRAQREFPEIGIFGADIDRRGDLTGKMGMPYLLSGEHLYVYKEENKMLTLYRRITLPDGTGDWEIVSKPAQPKGKEAPAGVGVQVPTLVTPTIPGKPPEPLRVGDWEKVQRAPGFFQWRNKVDGRWATPAEIPALDKLAKEKQGR